MKILTDLPNNTFLVSMTEKELWDMQSEYTKNFMDHYGLRVSAISKNVEFTTESEPPTDIPPKPEPPPNIIFRETDLTPTPKLVFCKLCNDNPNINCRHGL